MGENRDVRATLAELRSKPEPPAMVVQGACDAIFRILLDSPNTAALFLELGGVETVIAAVKRFPSAAEVAEETFTLLWKLIKSGGSTAAKAVIDGGGFDMLDTAVKRFPEGSAASEAALLLAGSLADWGLVKLDLPEDLTRKEKEVKGRAFAYVM